MKRTLLAVGLFAGIALHAQTPPDPTAGFREQDLERGKKLFVAHCGPCHGIDGSGGRGPDLISGKLKRSPTAQAMFDIAQQGIPGTIMDGAWQLSEGELWRVVAYVRSMGRTSRTPLPGDKAHGEQLYARLGCAGCHIVNGAGNGFGPELTAIGARRNAAYLRRSLLDPGADIPEGFTYVRASSRDGHAVEGIRVNEDTFTVQIRDFQNMFHSLRKADLTSLEAPPKRSAMPRYSDRLKPDELDDLVAYMADLRGQL